MKRPILLILLLSAIAAAAVVALSGQLFAAPTESEELAFPTMSPAVVVQGEPTFVTFSAALTDPEIRAPKLQVFDPAKGKWKTIRPLKDDGKNEDQVKADRVFTQQLWIFDSGGVTQIGYRKGNGQVKVKREVPSPARIRLVAKQMKRPGLLVSAPLSLDAWAQATIGGVNLSYPMDWQTLALGTGGVGLLSTTTASFYASLGEEAVEIPPDIGVVLLDNSTTLSVSEFGDAFANGYYQGYAVRNERVVNGTPVIEYDDATAALPNAPVLVAFKDAPPNVILISLNQHAAGPEARRIFEGVLESISIP